MNLNKCVFSGNCTKDPVMRKTASGNDMCQFSIAVGVYRKNSDNDTFYVNVTCWNYLATIASNLRKGTKVVVIGQMDPPYAYNRASDNKAGANLALTAEMIEFTNPNRTGNGAYAPKQDAQQQEPPQADGGFSGYDPGANPWFG